VNLAASGPVVIPVEIDLPAQRAYGQPACRPDSDCVHTPRSRFSRCCAMISPTPPALWKFFDPPRSGGFLPLVEHPHRLQESLMQARVVVQPSQSSAAARDERAAYLPCQYLRRIHRSHAREKMNTPRPPPPIAACNGRHAIVVHRSASGSQLLIGPGSEGTLYWRRSWPSVSPIAIADRTRPSSPPPQVPTLYFGKSEAARTTPVRANHGAFRSRQ